jgi:hypothetical protein
MLNVWVCTQELTTKLAFFAGRSPDAEVMQAEAVLAEWCALHTSMQTNGESLRQVCCS